ncbi:Carnosine synthase 1 protein [Rutstroemia sp. NJR-2017a BVV2]|nr:Carnosine synthase 1 protein [Rutstroemia sp. NJR-2017a BVV2]
MTLGDEDTSLHVEHNDDGVLVKIGPNQHFFSYDLDIKELESWSPFSAESGITIYRAVLRLKSDAPSGTEDGLSNPVIQQISRLLQSPLSRSTDFSPYGEKAVVERRVEFMLSSLIRAFNSPVKQTEILLFVSQRSGHLVRSDILDIRLTDCPVIEGFVNLANSTRTFTDTAPLLSNLNDTLVASAGACFISEHLEPETLHQELQNRLSIPMIQHGVRPSRTLAILECGKSAATGLGIFNAAKALNINVVALDKPGHWISKPEFASWREAFIPIDRNLDEGLADRIIAAIEKYDGHIDGIISFFDPLLPATAAAAARLGLPAAPASALEIATDKHKTSEFDGRPAYRISSLEEAIAITGLKDSNLFYPLIVKPCSGWGSEGVFRVETETELIRAIESIDFERHGTSFVIENYCNGPEVDANFVLCDGELLFFEASDDFPKDADLAGNDDSKGSLQTFIEVANVLPSSLPEDELELLKTSLHQSLLRLGFTSGFFHLEARVQGSRTEYVKGKDGLIDLQDKQTPGSRSPSAWLIEINARPPGLQASWASRATYGVDFWGLALSFALDDKNTARVLAAPFKSNNQYWCQIVFIPVQKGGVFESGDACQDLVQRHPELAVNISRSLCFFKRGDRVPEPSSGILTWIAYYLVFSRKSRRDLLKIAELVRQETKFTIS